MTPQQLPFNRGWYWIKQGYLLFMEAPLLWVAMMFICLTSALILSAIPVFGDPLVSLLTPVVIVGIMVACHKVSQKQELELPMLFSGFQLQPSRLITLGGITMLAQFAILWLMKLSGGEELVDLMMNPPTEQDKELVRQVINQSGEAIMLGFSLLFLLIMSMQFAPMLVAFQQQTPLQAMKLSLQAFFVNVQPMLLYSGVFMVLGIFATLPMLLGWLILLPLIFTSLYVCYNDIFPPEPSIESIKQPLP